MPEESIETKVARLDERIGGFQNVLIQMADDQRRMAESYEKLVESNHRTALLEVEITSIKEGQRQLWIKHDAMAAEAKSNSQKWLWEISKVLLAAFVAIVIYKATGIHV